MPPDSLTHPSRIEHFSETYLTHVKGDLAGKPLLFADWQRQLLRTVFNQIHENGARQVRTFYLSVPRKAGKSTLAAAIALYMLVSDGEPGAEIYSAAKAAKQARIVFDIAKAMVLQNPTLRKRVRVLRDALVYKDNTYKPLSTEARSAHGLNPSCLIVDELHCFESQLDREYYEALTSAQGARSQPLTMILTTAGYDSNSLCGGIDQYAQKVADGVIDDPSFGSYIRRARPEDDWQDPETWRKAQPNLGVSVSEAYLREQANRAKDSPLEVLKFQRFQLNMWVENVEQYISLDEWDACDFPVDPRALESRECFGGLDLSNTTDLSAFVLCFPPEVEDEPYQLLSFCWLPQENLRERVRRDRVSYDVWAQQGFLELTPGNIIDHDFIIARVLELSERYQIREIHFDRWGSVQVSTALQAAGLEVVQFGQGFKSFSSPTKQLLNLVKQKRLAHGGHPVLRWCVSNLRVEMDDAENYKPSKKLARERIDLAVATIMSLDSAVAMDTRPKSWGFADLYAQEHEPQQGVGG